MIANSIICMGSARILQKLYVNDLAVSGTTSFSSLAVSGNATVGGTLGVTGNTTLSTMTATGTVILSKTQDLQGTADNKPALIIGGTTSQPHLECDANEIQQKASATTVGDFYINTDGGSVYLSNGSKIKANNGTFTTQNLTVSTSASIAYLTSPKIVADNIHVLDTLRATTYNIDSTSCYGGSIYVAPTIIFSSNTTVAITAISGTTVTAAFIDSNSINTDTIGGVQWTQYSKIKISGRLGNTVLGNNGQTCTGTLTAKMNTTAGRINCTFTCDNASELSVKTYATSEVHDLRVMIYEKGINSTTSYPVGMLLTGYGTNNNSYIDIYQGEDSRTKPRVRLGKLDGLDSTIKVGGVSPTGWGLFADNAYLKGVIYATAGVMGGWTISEDRIYHTGNTPSSANTVLSPGGVSSTTAIGGSSGTNTWAFTIKNIFGVTTSGALYSSSGKIGGWTIETNSLYNGTYGTANSALVCTGTTSSKSIGGSASLSGWTFTSGANFGVTKEGALYCSDAHVSGAITATSGSIAGFTLSNGVLYSNNHAAWNTNADGIYLSSIGIAGGKQGIWHLWANGSAKIGALTLSADGTLAVPAANITGTLTAGQIATGAITADKLSADAIVVGSRNLTYKTAKKYVPTSYNCLQISLTENLVKGQQYTLQLWGASISRSDKTAVFGVYWGGGTVSLLNLTADPNLSGHYYGTFVAPNNSHESTNNAWLDIYNSPPVGASGVTYNATATHWKLERGNRATDYSLAPEELSQGSLVISGTLTAGANSKIGPWTVSATSIYKVNATMGNATAGAAYFGDNGLSITDKFKVTAAGALTSTSGSIGGWTIQQNYLATGTATAPAANSMILCPSGTGTSYTIAGTALTGWMITAGTTFGVNKNGGVYATSGKIGGWTIDSNSLYTGTKGDSIADGSITFSTANFKRTINGVERENLRFAVGKGFAIRNDGYVYILSASVIADLSGYDATFDGTVNGLTGIFGGFKMSQGYLYSGTTLSSANFSVSSSGDMKVKSGTFGDNITLTTDGFYSTSFNNVDISGDDVYSDSLRVSQAGFTRHMVWHDPDVTMGKIHIAIGDCFAVRGDSGTNQLSVDVFQFRYRNVLYDPSVWVKNNADTTLSGKITITGGANTSGSAALNPGLTVKDILITGRLSNKFANDNSHASALPLGIYNAGTDKYIFYKISSSSIRYKDVGHKLTNKDIDKLYNVNVYNAKYKDGYLAEGDELEGKYFPMFIAEEIEKVLPEAVIHLDGKVENWNDRVMIPTMFQMIKSQKEQIDRLENELKKLKESR